MQPGLRIVGVCCLLILWLMCRRWLDRKRRLEVLIVLHRAGEELSMYKILDGLEADRVPVPTSSEMLRRLEHLQRDGYVSKRIPRDAVPVYSLTSDGRWKLTTQSTQSV